MLKKVIDALVEFFGSLLGVRSVIDRPLHDNSVPQAARRGRPPVDSTWMQERLAAADNLGADDVTPERAATLTPPPNLPWNSNSTEAQSNKDDRSGPPAKSFAGALSDAFKGVDVDAYLDAERASWEDDDEKIGQPRKRMPDEEHQRLLDEADGFGAPDDVSQDEINKLL